MNVLIVSFDYRPRLGGVATCAHELATFLARQADVNVTVLTSKIEGDQEHDIKSELDIIRVKLPRVAIISVLPLARQIRKTTKDKNIDYVINMLWMPDGLACLIASIFFNIKFATFAHGVEILESRSSFRKMIRSLLSPLKKMTFKRSYRTFSVSDFTKKLLDEICHLDNEKSIAVYNGVNSDSFHPMADTSDLSNKYGIPANRKIFFTLSRLEDYKGMDNAILAFKELKNEGLSFLYLIGGVGPDQSRLEKLIKENSLENEVKLLGRVADDEIVPFYSLADYHLLLSRYDAKTPNFEGFGLVFLEAAACKTPSIAGRSGGVPNAVIDGKTGILVDPNSVPEIKTVLRKAIVDELNQEKMSEDAFLFATQEMSWENMAQKILREFK